MAPRINQRELFAAPDDELRAQKIVDEELGPGFFVNYSDLPKNVGVMGDGGVRGHSVMISSDLPDPSGFLAAHPDVLDRVMGRLCAETDAACRVLFDITPGGGEFIIGEEGGDSDSLPLS